MPSRKRSWETVWAAKGTWIARRKNRRIRNRVALCERSGSRNSELAPVFLRQPSGLQIPSTKDVLGIAARQFLAVRNPAHFIGERENPRVRLLKPRAHGHFIVVE